MPECITFKPVHSAEYPYSVGIQFDRNSPVHEHINHFNHLAAWCDEHLEPGSWTMAISTVEVLEGGVWNAIDNIRFRFRYEKDAVMFILRWR